MKLNESEANVETPFLTLSDGGSESDEETLEKDLSRVTVAKIEPFSP
jgi:hypothetical protein